MERLEKCLVDPSISPPVIPLYLSNVICGVGCDLRCCRNSSLSLEALGALVVSTEVVESGTVEGVCLEGIIERGWANRGLKFEIATLFHEYHHPRKSCATTHTQKNLVYSEQDMFTLREINEIVREMCNYLDWTLGAWRTILSCELAF